MSDRSVSAYFPAYDQFRESADEADLVPVYRQLTADTLTPVSAFRLIDAGQCSFLFESVVGGERVGRYSFLGSDPEVVFQAFDRRVRVSDGAGEREYTSPDPLGELEKRVTAERAVASPRLPRFTGGAVGYAGYDVVRYSEHLPNAPRDDRQLPDLAFAFYDRMVIFDHIRKLIYVVGLARCREGGKPLDDAALRRSYERACGRIDELVRQLQRPPTELTIADLRIDGPAALDWTSNLRREEYEAAVERAKEYIRAGDIFQVVLSQRLRTETSAKPFDVYRTLRVVNPSPFMFYLRSPRVCLVGASPEIMVRVEDGRVTVRPLAGTRRRGATDEEDRRLAAELLADPKERAEHIMLVDLGRNDVGRIAAAESVELSDVMTVERYSHVMHITSNVTGCLAEGKTAFDALRSCLPAGTVSGAPKVRAMQIIDELEPHRRGPYGGAVGYFDYSGNMDTCIALRTLVMQGQTAYVQAGAGIVYDSVPALEYEETLNKAQGLLKAIEIAERQL